jgi:predicted metal-dependent enzyme (double-stranded beta helix superfamily)
MAESSDRQAAAVALLQTTLDSNDPRDMVATLNAAIPPNANIGEMIVHQSPELTMLFARVPARFQSAIHDHTIFACIGQLIGAETSTVYEPTTDGRLRVIQTLTAEAGQVITLPADAIHRIENPAATPACALHLYGGDFGAVAEKRSLWSFDDHERKAFSFPSLLRESLQTMQSNNNEVGYEAVLEAIPTARKLID